MELYIKNEDDPNFDPLDVQVDEDISMLLVQIETMLFTRKGEVMGEPEFGANLEDYVYSFMYNPEMIKRVVEDQMDRYVPLSKVYDTQVSVELLNETERNIMFLDITVDSRYKIGVSI